MTVPCFTRTERNGMFVIQALAGRMRHDCMIVNDTVKFVFDQVVQQAPLPELAARYLARAQTGRGGMAPSGDGDGQHQTVGDPHSDEERLRFDLYRTLMALRDREIGDYPFAEIAALLPPGVVLRGTTQVMPVCLLDETADFMARALAGARAPQPDGAGPPQNGNGTGPAAGSGVAAFYAFPAADQLNPAYFEPEQILRRHLDQAEVYFVAVDAEGAVEAVTAIQGLPQQPATLRVFFVAARDGSPEDVEERVGVHLARLCGLVQVTTLSAKIRFQWTTGDDPRATRHPVFDRVLADLGFRRSLVLADEFCAGNALVAYDRTLF